MASAESHQRAAFLLDHLRGGGGQKIPLMIAEELLERGYRVAFIACVAEGHLADEIPDSIDVVELKPLPVMRARAGTLLKNPAGFAHVLASTTLPYLDDLTRVLRVQNPDFLFTQRPHMNIEASLAVQRSGATTRLVIGEYNHLSRSHILSTAFQRRYLPPVIRRAYARAHAIVSLSDGVADDLAVTTGLPRNSIDTIYPPLPRDLADKARESPGHRWFASEAPPVVLGVGRLTKAKDFPTLLHAFARARQKREARLLILGDAGSTKKTSKRRNEYMTLARELGIAEDTALLGYVKNPYAFMARAFLFALSSVTEGFGMVVAQALACGCPVGGEHGLPERTRRDPRERKVRHPRARERPPCPGGCHPAHSGLSGRWRLPAQPYPCFLIASYRRPV